MGVLRGVVLDRVRRGPATALLRGVVELVADGAEDPSQHGETRGKTADLQVTLHKDGYRAVVMETPDVLARLTLRFT